MKQLLSMSKGRKGRQTQQQPSFTQQLDSQQQNFIYQDDQLAEMPEEPTQEQIVSSAAILGIRLPKEEDLLHIARQYLLHPTPSQYQTLRDEQGEYFYRHSRTGETTYEHPCDQLFRQRVIQERKNKIKSIKKAINKISLPKSKTAFVDNPFRNSAPQQEDNRQLKAGNFLYDDEPEPSQHVSSRKGSQRANKPSEVLKQLSEDIEVPLKPAPKKIPNTQNINQANMKQVKVQRFEPKPGNPHLLQLKKHQVQQTLKLRYRKLHESIQDQYTQALKSTANQQRRLKQAPLSQLQELLGTKLDRKKKQIEMQLMLQHTAELNRIRAEADQQYKRDIAALGAKYDIQGLFAQMAECRKFLSRDKTQSERNKYMEEIDRNISQLNAMQIQKNVAQIERQCRAQMHQTIDQQLKSPNNRDWRIYEQIKQAFEAKLAKIFSNYQATSRQQRVNQIQQNIFQSSNQQRQNQHMFSQLETLELRLKQHKEEGLTQRSNMSAKQTRLVDLLQARVK